MAEHDDIAGDVAERALTLLGAQGAGFQDGSGDRFAAQRAVADQAQPDGIGELLAAVAGGIEDEGAGALHGGEL